MFDLLRDTDLIAEMKRRGYVVRRRSEARNTLSWNRTEPIPDGVDFNAEALERIRECITQDMLRFETREGSNDKILGRPTVQSAYLFVL